MTTKPVRPPPLGREKLARSSRVFVRVFGPRLVSVRFFGYARGEAHEDSDVDCLVWLDRVEPVDNRAVTDLAADLTADRSRRDFAVSEAAFEVWKTREFFASPARLLGHWSV